MGMANGWPYIAINFDPFIVRDGERQKTPSQLDNSSVDSELQFPFDSAAALYVILSTRTPTKSVSRLTTFELETASA